MQRNRFRQRFLIEAIAQITPADFELPQCLALGAIARVELHQRLMPGFIVWIHHDQARRQSDRGVGAVAIAHLV